jgi:hypothetical protein
MGVVGVISYVNHRRKFLKRVTVYFCITFITALAFSFNTDRSLFISSRQIKLTELNKNDQEVAGPSLLNSAFRFIGSMLRDKISN